jgi:hypothetical protein
LKGKMGSPTKPLPDAATAGTAPAGAYDDRFRLWFALVVWASSMSFFVFVSIRAPQLPGDTLGLIIGSLLTANSLVLGYYFASSSGSTTKTAMKDKP